MNIYDIIIKSMKNASKIIKNTEKYTVYSDNNGNRYIEAADNSFHLFFKKADGFTAKWGKTIKDDPAFCQYGNEIADIEITKACNGIRDNNEIRIPCPWCYKSNSAIGNYMSFKKFKIIFDKLNEPKTMTQIAFGTDASLISNPDIWKIFDYTIKNNVTPNVTVADIDQTTAKKLVSKCGAIAVSYYAQINKNRCYDSVKFLVDQNKKQNKSISVNIHALLADETYDDILNLIDDYSRDSRLSGMNAIVFLSLKQKGRGIHFNKLSNDQFKTIIKKCFDKNIKFGMDSCSANKFILSIKDMPNYKQMLSYIEPCEKCCFSLYIDCNGIFYPCSFMENEGNWKTGIDMTKISNFYNDVWNSDKVLEERNFSINQIKNSGCTSCRYYDI